MEVGTCRIPLYQYFLSLLLSRFFFFLFCYRKRKLDNVLSATMKPINRNALLKNKGLFQRLNVKYNKLDPCGCKLNVRSRLLVKPGPYLTPDPFRCPAQTFFFFFQCRALMFFHFSAFFLDFQHFFPRLLLFRRKKKKRKKIFCIKSE